MRVIQYQYIYWNCCTAKLDLLEFDVCGVKGVFSSYAFFTRMNTYVKVEIHFSITFEVNECFDEKNSAFPMRQHTLVILIVKYKLLRRV